MKNLTKKIAGFLLMAFALMFAPQEIIASSVSSDVEIIVKDNLIGGWEYTVEGAPEGYEKGFMMIVKQGDMYKAQIQLAGGAVNAENVVVKGNKITFTVNVEGETVSVALEANGSKLSGTSTSPSNGTMKITGVKSISPE
ncbi:hypothetical protein [Maribacter sp. 2308TA10-17]|uniref:hypothetical protein n=1 Tax=Maribacter sp. 2308TA10-17 TaxID=3386276 RepID=UPI0039BC8575